MDKFLEFVKKEAVRQTGRNFFLDSGEGREMPNPPPELETDVEDLSGWLLTDEQLEEVRQNHIGRLDMFERDDFPCAFAEWGEDNGKLVITFMETTKDGLIPFNR